MNVAICGKLGSGKTTVARYLVENYSYERVSFADPMREITQYVLGIKDKTDPRYRPAMQELGTDWGRKWNENCWVDILLFKTTTDIQTKMFVVDDVRFQNEVESLLKAGWKFIFLKTKWQERECRCLERDGNFDPASMLHKSETNCDCIAKDFKDDLFFIDNNGSLDSLYRAVDQFMELNKVGKKNSK